MAEPSSSPSEPSFLAGLYKIRLPPEQNPIKRAQEIIEAHNSRKTIKGKFKSCYRPAEGAGEWQTDWNVQVFWVFHPQHNPFAQALKIASKSKEVEWEGGGTTSFVTFLSHEIPEKELFALTVNKGWKVAQPYADTTFPRAVARRVTSADPYGLDYRPLVGNLLYGSNAYKKGGTFSLGGSNLDSMWVIFKGFATAVLPGSSLAQILSEEMAPSQPSPKKLKLEKENKEPELFGIEVTFAHLRIRSPLRMDMWQRVISHCAKIGRGERTWTGNDPQRGELEVDQRHFEVLDNIEPIKDPDLKKVLNGAVMEMIWRDFGAFTAAGSITIAHTHYLDYYRSHEFTLSLGEEEQTFFLPPSYEEVLSTLHVFMEGKSVHSREDFIKLFKRCRLTFSLHDKWVSLLQMVQGEVHYNGQLYFYIDERWLQIVGQQFINLQKDFYFFHQEARIKEKDSGALKTPWIAKEEWARMPCQEIADEAGMEVEEVEKILQEVKGETFSVLDLDGTIHLPYVTRALFIDDHKKPFPNFLNIRKKTDALNALLLERFEKKEKVTLSDIEKIFGETPKSKKSNSQSQPFLEEGQEKGSSPSEEASGSPKEGDAKRVFEALIQLRPIATPLKGTPIPVHILDEEGKVLYPYLSKVTIPNPQSALKNAKKEIEEMLKRFDGTGKPITVGGLLRCFKKGAKKDSAGKVLDQLKKLAHREGPSVWQMNGPPPKEVDPRLKPALQMLHDLHKQVGEEEQYSRSFLREGYLVLDQVSATKQEKIELFDVMDCRDPQKIFLHHIKGGSIGQKTRDALSQVRVAAQVLKNAIGGKDDRYLRNLYHYASNPRSGSVFSIKLARLIQNLPGRPDASGLERFIELFHTRKIIFVYSFIDESHPEKRLEGEGDPGIPFIETDFNKPSFPEDAFQGLMKHGMLDKIGYLSDRFLGLDIGQFATAIEKPREEADPIYELLDARRSKFNSTIGKLELLQLAKEFKSLPFEFKIYQIPRAGSLGTQPLSTSGIHSFDSSEITTLLEEDTLLSGVSDSEPGGPSEHPSYETSRLSAGFRNQTGNDCFLNSLLQLIIHTPLLAYLQEEKHFDRKEMKGETLSPFLKAAGPIIEGYQKQAFQGIGVVEGSYRLREALGFGEATQEDPHDAFGKILNGYQIQGTSLAASTHYERSINLQAGKEIKEEGLSPMPSTGIQKGEIDINLPLIINVRRKGLGLSSVLDEWVKPQQGKLEPFKGVWEGKNYEFPFLSETLLVDSLPKSLFVTLGIYDDQDQKSYTCVVDTFTQKIEGKTYEVRGIIAHNGPSAKAGHYVSYLNINGSWVCFDDDKSHFLKDSNAVQIHMSSGKFDPYILYLEEESSGKDIPSSESLDNKHKLENKRGYQFNHSSLPISTESTPPPHSNLGTLFHTHLDLKQLPRGEEEEKDLALRVAKGHIVEEETGEVFHIQLLLMKELLTLESLNYDELVQLSWRFEEIQNLVNNDYKSRFVELSHEKLTLEKEVLRWRVENFLEELPEPQKMITPTPQDSNEFKLKISEETKKLLDQLRELLKVKGKCLGTALDNGDCFFDAVRQGLEQCGRTLTVKNLRNIVAKMIAQSPEKYRKFYKGEDLSYEDFLRRVGLTTEEAIKAFGAPTWGKFELEGEILSEYFGIKFRLYECISSKDAQRIDLVDLLESKTEVESPQEVELACYPGHFMPVFNETVNSKT